MRIHTSATRGAVYRLLDGLPGVYFDGLTEHGSRTHARALEVRLEGNGYRVNSGRTGAGDLYGATWDEWGVFLARLYELDPSASCWAYTSAEDFHRKTGNRFRDRVMPADTHKRHTWVWVARMATCKSCSASIDQRKEALR